MILTLTVAVAVAASFLTSWASATALQPELTRLHILRTLARAPLFGVTSTAVAVVSGVLVAGADAPQLGLLWIRQLEAFTSGHGRVEDAVGAVWIVSLVSLVPQHARVWAGGGSRGARVGRQVVTASAVAALLSVLTILAVVFAPALVLGAQWTGDALAANWRELTLTLGPALSIAAAAAIAATLAQARGTGNDLRALTLIGFSVRARTTVILVTALLLGSVGSLVGAAAALSAFVLAMPFGADLASLSASELTVPIAVASCSTAVIATMFLVSEWMGHRLGHRERRR